MDIDGKSQFIAGLDCVDEDLDYQGLAAAIKANVMITVHNKSESSLWVKVCKTKGEGCDKFCEIKAGEKHLWSRGVLRRLKIIYHQGNENRVSAFDHVPFFSDECNSFEFPEGLKYAGPICCGGSSGCF
ncbi:MAG: hypothetical protein P8M80_01795 [Pirellulaceae bacterium]|nr:hypothetical protein [Pirellulaceae bacterium]